MRFIPIHILLGLLGCSFSALQTEAKKIAVNDNWLFSLEADSMASRSDHNDKSWLQVTLPHDWSIQHRFDRNTVSGNDGGYLPAGCGWYRKTFDFSDKDLEKDIRLYFEGVYMDSEVYVNGKYVGGHPYGYSSFYVDITPYLKKGKNVVAVKADNSRQKNCRWYSGSGIYRNVHLITKDKVAIAPYGITITTPDLNTAIVTVRVNNNNDSDCNAKLCVSLGKGYEKSEEVSLPAKSHKDFKFEFVIPDAKSWSPDSPALYNCNVTLAENNRTIDEEEVRFGFRTINYSAERGLLLNGKPINLNGGCIHHDNGILGAAAYDRAERKRVEQMKAAGFNAVRTSHNIPSEAFLDACDEVGLLVIDEAFDGWRDAKNDYDYHKLFDKYWQQDIDAMILRDKNHPSIFCWSIGNEVIERDKIEVVTTAKKLADRCHELDPTRPVTSALACWGKVWETYDPLAAEHDIVGYNYMIQESEKDHQRVPERVMMQTESYPNDVWRNYRKVADHPYIIGDFVWTAMDYIGESGIGRWYYEGDVEGEHYERPLYPWHAAYCGDIDLTGLRKPVSHYRSMLWNEDGEKLYMAVREPDGYKGKIKTTLWGTWPTFESWNWPGHEGKMIDVEVYSRYPKVRLWLNDELVGEKEVSEMKAVFPVVYAPGELRAEGVSADGYTENFTITTSGAEVAKLKVTPDGENFTSGTGELAYITIEALDKMGVWNTTADNQIKVTVNGNAELIGLGNADIKDEDPYFDASHKLWKGRALAVVRSNGKPGSATVRIESPGLKTETVKLKFK